MMLRRTLLLLAACTALGCGAKRNMAYLEQPGAGQAADAAILSQAQEAWNAREDRNSLQEAMTLYAKLVEQDPNNRGHMEILARGYYLLGVGHADSQEELLAYYDAGARWGERILGLNDAFRACVEAGSKDYQCLEHATAEDVPGIYWAYSNHGKWAVAMGFATVLKHKNKLKAFIDRVYELDPDYYYAAADRGLGAYYAKAPSFAGGDLDLARKHFEESLAAAPDYFGTKVLMAEYYCVKTQDKQLFTQLLTEVSQGDPEIYPDVVAIQKLEQQNARDLLAKADDFFE